MRVATARAATPSVSPAGGGHAGRGRAPARRRSERALGPQAKRLRDGRQVSDRARYRSPRQSSRRDLPLAKCRALTIAAKRPLAAQERGQESVTPHAVARTRRGGKAGGWVRRSLRPVGRRRCGSRSWRTSGLARCPGVTPPSLSARSSAVSAQTLSELRSQTGPPRLGSGAAVSIRVIWAPRSADRRVRPASAACGNRHTLNDKPFHIGPAVGYRRS